MLKPFFFAQRRENRDVDVDDGSRCATCGGAPVARRVWESGGECDPVAHEEVLAFHNNEVKYSISVDI